jgi:hypothetical protein
MNQLLRAYPSGELHVILDNIKSHDSKEVQEWHKRPCNKRAVFHFIPTYSSWLNLAEVLFNLLQAKVLRRGGVSLQTGAGGSYHGLHPEVQQGGANLPLDEDRRYHHYFS